MADPYKTKQARSPLDRADSNIPFQDWQRLVTRPAGEEKRLARGFSVADGVGDLGTMRNPAFIHEHQEVIDLRQ
jgi:hypothetical protein